MQFVLRYNSGAHRIDILLLRSRASLLNRLFSLFLNFSFLMCFFLLKFRRFHVVEIYPVIFLLYGSV